MLLLSFALAPACATTVAGSTARRTVAGGIPAEGATTVRDAGYKVDANEFYLLPGSWFEYKYRPSAGNVLVYS